MPNGIENGNLIDKDNIINSLIHQSSVFLPINIFANGASGLESISKYLKDDVGLRYCTIADLLNRDDRTIWGAHKSANEKLNGNLSMEKSTVKIPLSIFKDRSLSVLEALAEYLKEELNLRYCKIAVLLNKDPRTIWTVYNRAKKKRKRNVKEN
jgi:hypothetical protein